MRMVESTSATWTMEDETDSMNAARNVKPAELGFRLPAEWDPHDATWIAWPHNCGDWPGKLTPVRWAFVEIARKLAASETVRILVNSKAHEVRARRLLARADVPESCIQFFRIPTDRAWTRDFGPIFLREDSGGELAVVRFKLNAWARYDDWSLDDAVAGRVGGKLGFKTFSVTRKGRRFVLEGGSVDTNGNGVFLASEPCLLDNGRQVRNPGVGRGEVESVLGDYLGAKQILWMGGGMSGDDTNGHVDNFCRFVGPERVVLCEESSGRDPNARALEENRECLEGQRLNGGSNLDVVRIPVPSPLIFDGHRLPASYTNFYISNGHVLVPTFNDPKDRIALGILSELFKDREVVGIHAVDLIWGLGGIHCLTREQPKSRGS